MNQKEIKVINLPTIGQPLSIKTAKQGRKVNIKEYKTGGFDTIKINKNRITTVATLRNNCKRIIDYKWSTEKEKKVATSLYDSLKNINLGILEFGLPRNLKISVLIVKGIVVRLSKIDRNF